MKMNTRRISCLLTGACCLFAGCNETTQPDLYKAVSQVDAAQAQQALDKTVESNPMGDAVAEASLADPKEPPKSESSAATRQTNDQSATAGTPTQGDQGAKTETDKQSEAKVAPKLLVAEKGFSPTAPDNVLRVAFDDIDLEKIFEIKEATKDLPEYFPKWLKGLDGQRIRIRGYMVPTFQAEDLVGFTLARDTSACCFGPNPKVSYLIEVWMKKGKTSEYIHYRPFDVVGVLHVGTEVSPGQLYKIDDAIVIAK